MPIELVTGLPGSGKSLGAVDRMLQWRDSDATRPVFVLGVDGLKDGVAQEITPEDLQHWYDYPPGSIFVIDECQKYFPMRRAGDSPAWIKKLSEHRHLGHDFLLMTQAPGYLDNYVRGLVDRHTHLVRKFGTHMVDRYEYPAVCMSPLSPSERKRAVKKLWTYPKRCFELYKSAELHTVKRRIPKKFFVLLAAPLVIAAIVFAVPKIMARTHPKAASVSSAAGSQTHARSADSDRHHWDTPAQYVKDFLPRIANAPWSAPVYDGRAIKAEPDLMCIEYDRVIEGSTQHLCSCFTEQVTPYRIGNVEECRRYARDGLYNPYRQPIDAGDANRRAGGRDTDSSFLPSSMGSNARGVTPDPASTGNGWQPAWRTRSYVQPEHTKVTASVPQSDAG